MMSSNDVELNDVAFYDAIPISEITENSDGTFTATPSPSGLSEDIYFPVYITGDNGIYEYPSDHEGYGHVFGGNIEVNQVGYYTKYGVVMHVLGEVAPYVLFTNGDTPDADGNYILSDDSSVYVCFLKGTQIKSRHGYINVEDICVGDEIVSVENGIETFTNVTWVGCKKAHVMPYLPLDASGYPVRILKDAIAHGVPYKDMLITAEHCLFFNGKFVPVRMLVNGNSIFYDKSITSYDYYHIETNTHSVIIADGVETESYLNTGNKKTFNVKSNIYSIHEKKLEWNKDSYAPLCVDRDFVEPIFQKLKERGERLNPHHVSDEKLQITQEPNLFLLTEAGKVIRPLHQIDSQYSFMLPANTKCVRIISRASRPCDVIGPFMDDRRYMGVAVSDVCLCSAQQQHQIVSHLQAEKPKGWHDTDWIDCAWTNGNALLPLGDYLEGNKIGILSMTIRETGSYILPDQNRTMLRRLG